MTCETCGDTKVIRRLPRPRRRRLNVGVAPMHTPIEEPCPDCTPVPFARSFDRYIRFQGDDGYEREIVATAADLAADAASDLVTAVEQREAKLRGLLLKVSEALCFGDFDGVGQCIGCEIRFDLTTGNAAVYQQHIEECPQGRALHEIAELVSHDRGPDYVSGDVACGLAFDVGMRQWEVHAMGAAWESLDCNEVGAARVISRFLVANGLQKPTPKRLTALINELELRDAQMTNAVADDGSGDLEFTARWRVSKAELRYDGSTGDVITRRTALPAPTWRRVENGVQRFVATQVTPEGVATIATAPTPDGPWTPTTEAIRCPSCGANVMSLDGTPAAVRALNGTLRCGCGHYLSPPIPRATASPPPPSPGTDTAE